MAVIGVFLPSPAFDFLEGNNRPFPPLRRACDYQTRSQKKSRPRKHLFVVFLAYGKPGAQNARFPCNQTPSKGSPSISFSFPLTSTKLWGPQRRLFWRSFEGFTENLSFRYPPDSIEFYLSSKVLSVSSNNEKKRREGARNQAVVFNFINTSDEFITPFH